MSAPTPIVAGVHLNHYGGYAHIDLAGANTSSGGYISLQLREQTLKDALYIGMQAHSLSG